jgi:microcystin-dependent protein
MATHNFTVRAGFTVITGASHANVAGAVVKTAGQAVVLSDAQMPQHLHKLEPADSDAITAIAGVAGRLNKPSQDIY